MLAEALGLLRHRRMREATVWTFCYLDSQATAVAVYQQAGATVLRRKLGWEKTL